MSEAALEVAGLHKRFGDVLALDGATLTVDAGEFVVVLGPTGAGKTTLLRAIAGLERPDAGEVRLFGKDAAGIPPADRDVALVFQNFSLYPSRTVRENLEFPLRAPGRGLTSADITERLAWAAALLKIDRLFDRPARQLSGGEMQRVAIGRAIVRRPKLFLMDEPLSNLDAKLREELRIELRELARGLGTPVVWVTHDPIEALSMADRVVVLSAGRVLQDAPPEEIYFRPASPVAARLLGNPPMNVFAVHRNAGWWLSSDGTRIVQAEPGPEDSAHIGFRAQHVEPEGGETEGTIEVVEDLGVARMLLVRWAGQRVHVLVGREQPARQGDHVRLLIPRERVVVWQAG